MDGVLVDAKNIHFEALNKALGKQYSITWDEHLNKYDGLKTHQKLKMLSIDKDLPPSLYDQVWNNKQKYTLEALEQLQPDMTLQSVFHSLVEDLPSIS